MSIRFAGSRSLDERRRRRLASENEETVNAAPATVAANVLVGPARVVREARGGLTNGVPFRKFISPKLWKYWGIGVLGASLIGVILSLGFHAPAVSRVGGPRLGDFVSLSDGRLAACFNSFSLLLAGQVAVVIYWARSRSREDFQGRFRIWIWSYWAWFVAAGAVATDAHISCSETVLWLTQLKFWQQQTLCWLVPVSTVGSVLWLGLNRDMGGCRSSQSLFGMATFFCAMGLMFKLGLGPDLSLSWQQVGLSGSSMLGCWALLMSMLLHARHVIYFTAEPPPIRRWSLLNRFTRRRRQTARDVDESLDHAGDTSNDDADKVIDATAENTSKANVKATENGDDSPPEATAVSKSTNETESAADSSQSVEADSSSTSVRTKTRSRSNKKSRAKKTSRSKADSSLQDSAPSTPVIAEESADAPHVVDECVPDESTSKEVSEKSGDSIEHRIDENNATSANNRPPKPNLNGLSKRQRRAAMKRWREELQVQG